MRVFDASIVAQCCVTFVFSFSTSVLSLIAFYLCLALFSVDFVTFVLSFGALLLNVFMNAKEPFKASLQSL